jgi:hypothetical protein
MPDFKIIVEGPQARTAAEELAAAVKQAFGIHTRPAPVQTETVQESHRLDPAMISAVTGAAALVLSLPAATLQVLDAVDRIKKRKQVETLIQAAQKLREADPGIEIRITLPDGTRIELRRADPNHLLDPARR